jgi:DNA excision repair protein ERCC-3
MPVEAGPALLVSGPDTLLLRVDHRDAERCRAGLARFAELATSPDLVHTYRLTDLGLWNAAAAGLTAAEATAVLTEHTAGPVPAATIARIEEAMERFGRVAIVSLKSDEPISNELDDGADGATADGATALQTDSPALLDELLDDPAVGQLTGERIGPTRARVERGDRGPLKQALVRLRWPADDRAALSPGEGFSIPLRPDVELRPYQRQAVDSWTPSGTGVVVLPCGAGKTITAIAAASEVGTRTLILVTGEASMIQWERELTAVTAIDPADIARYSGRHKQVGPVTLATYQVMATRRDGAYRHLDLIQRGDWGLVIYDEVHLLPSAVFNLTAGIQARRRLGLTATLVREDGREADVFTLVGPKRFDVPWSELTLQGWIAPARCVEVRVAPTAEERMAHATADQRDKAAVAAGVAAKLDAVETLLNQHRGEPTLVIGTFLDGLRAAADRFDLPLVTGETSTARRVELFDSLRDGSIDALAVSKVANFSLDLPEVSVAIQVSGSFGSRQEEAQRLGRIIRPKHDGRQAHFYTVVARDTVEVDLARQRQRFLAEQGYRYEIIDADAL